MEGSGIRKVSAGTAAAVVSALVAAASAALAVTQNNSANRQSVLADRQSLTSLVAEITHDVNLEEKAETSHVAEEQTLLEQALLSDAEQALALTEALHQSVPAVDSYEIGTAFSRAVEYAKALSSFKRAVRAGAGPRTRANALREEAHIYYLLGGSANVAVARRDIALAYGAFDHQPDVTAELIDHDHAFTDLFNAEQTASLDCSKARSEVSNAKNAIHADRAILDGPMRFVLSGAEHATEHCSTSAQKSLGIGVEESPAPLEAEPEAPAPPEAETESPGFSEAPAPAHKVGKTEAVAPAVGVTEAPG
jgi:hypothetical protein